MESIISQINVPTVITIVAAIFGSYAAIRSDIKNLYTRILAVEKDVTRVEQSSSRAHQRMDEHITDFHAKATK